MRKIALLFCLIATVGRADELPEAPSHAVSTMPHQPEVKKKDSRADVWTNRALMAGVAIVVWQDTKTTLAFQNHPCHCMHEANPLAINTPNTAANILFQASMGVALLGTSQLLRHYGKKNLSRMLLSGDIIGETIVIHNNYALYDRVDKAWNAYPQRR